MEKAHIIDAFHFESGSVKDKKIRQAVADMFAHVAPELGEQIAAGIGVDPPKPVKQAMAADKTNPPKQAVPAGMIASSPALSQENTIKTARTRKVAVLVENGFCDMSVKAMMDGLKAAGAAAETVSSSMTPITGKNGMKLEPNKSLVTANELIYDGVFIPGGADHVEALKANIDARCFIKEAIHYAKTVGATDEAAELLEWTDTAGLTSGFPGETGTPWVSQGVVIVKGAQDMNPFCTEFIGQLSMHRHWARLNNNN